MPQVIRSRSKCLLLLALGVATAGLTTAARAEMIQISAITFVNRAGGTGDVLGDSNFGTLTNATGTFYAPVPFPTDAAAVCSFVLVHRDNDAEFDITARLLKKRIVIGANPFDLPLEMARVQTNGGVAGVAKARDNTIKRATVNVASGFYYVELVIPANTLEVLGVQIEFGSTC